MSENAEKAALADLRDRLTEANLAVSDLADEVWEPSERARLYGKAEGIRVARSYVEEALRTPPEKGVGS